MLANQRLTYAQRRFSDPETAQKRVIRGYERVVPGHECSKPRQEHNVPGHECSKLRVNRRFGRTNRSKLATNDVFLAKNPVFVATNGAFLATNDPFFSGKSAAVAAPFTPFGSIRPAVVSTLRRVGQSVNFSV